MTLSPNVARDRVLRPLEGEQLVRVSLITPPDLVPRLPQPIVTDEDEAPDPVAEAYAAGFSEGQRLEREAAAHNEAAEHRRALEELAASLREAADSMEGHRQSVVDQVLAEAVDLVFELLRLLVGEELELHEDPTREAVTRALAYAPVDGELTVRLHPGSGLAAWELESLLPGRHVRVIEDPAVQPRGCVLEVGACLIDGTMEAALDRVRAALEHLRRPTLHSTTRAA